MNQLQTLAIETNALILALAGMGLIIIWVLAASVVSIHKTRSREETRREMAAYVAEGSIDPEQAQKLLQAETNELEKKIGDAVMWGTISAGKAESLIRAARASNADPAPVHKA